LIKQTWLPLYIPSLAGSILQVHICLNFVNIHTLKVLMIYSLKKSLDNTGLIEARRKQNDDLTAQTHTRDHMMIALTSNNKSWKLAKVHARFSSLSNNPVATSSAPRHGRRAVPRWMNVLPL
jgi:hypothetical protein